MNALALNPLEALLDDLAERIAARVVAIQHQGQPGWIDQSASPLGRRRHCAAVRARVARGEPGAAVVGRRHLLSPNALSEALASGNRQPVETTTDSIADELRREVALIRGARAA